MSHCVNKVIILGNLGADPVIRKTQDGRSVANFSVATSETWKNKLTNERKERTEWHRVVIFNEGLCTLLERFARKGTRIYLEGHIQTRKWKDKDGQERYTTEILVHGFKSNMVLLTGGRDDPRGPIDMPEIENEPQTRETYPTDGENFQIEDHYDIPF